MISDTAAAIAHARQVFLEQCRTEAAGLFWIGAELAILVAVIAARREVAPRLGERQTPGGIRRVALFAALAVLVLATATQTRYLYWTPVHARIASGELVEAQALMAAYRAQNHAHYALWAGFTLAWVLLEISIVYQGWQVCRGLRTLFVPTAIAAVGFLLAVPSAHAEGLAAALHAEDLADTLHRNALGLWLRMAGLVWIAVEWVAAVLLWQTYRLLRSAAPPQEDGP